LAAQASLLRNLDHLPDSMLEVVNLTGKIYSDRIMFTEKALESAKHATLRNLNIAWKCLRSMATILYDLHFQHVIPFRDIAQRFRDSTGFELAVGESETTKRNISSAKVAFPSAYQLLLTRALSFPTQSFHVEIEIDASRFQCSSSKVSVNARQLTGGRSLYQKDDSVQGSVANAYVWDEAPL